MALPESPSMADPAIDRRQVVLLPKQQWLEQLQGWQALVALTGNGKAAAPRATLAAARAAATSPPGERPLQPSPAKLFDHRLQRPSE